MLRQWAGVQQDDPQPWLLCRDIAPEGASLAESNAMLDKVVELAEHLQQETGKKVLWGTAQLFKHPRFMHGAATSALPRYLGPVWHLHA